MPRVAPVNLTYNPKTLWFDPRDLTIAKGDNVVVETARGKEFGVAADDIFEVDESQLKSLKSPLKPVIRVATEQDKALADKLAQKSLDAMPIFREMAAETNEEMHPVSVEFLFDTDKAVFYFESEERIDFRDLVRKLASQFHVRIDMRQIGVRDEARIVGGLGHCGEELCCKRLGGEFCPVSIRMAKEQDLSLNPQKISGLCGRLMCCLRYEYDAYKDFKERAPKVGATIQTPDGPATVTELDVPREVVTLKIGEEKPVRVPLARFDKVKDGARPNAVGKKAWAEAQAEQGMLINNEPISFLTNQFTGSDKLSDGGVRRIGSSRRRGSESARSELRQDASLKHRGSRNLFGKEGASKSRRNRKGEEAQGSRRSQRNENASKPRRRRSTVLSSGEDGQTRVVTTSSEPSAKQETSAKSSYRKQDQAGRTPRNRSTAAKTGGQAKEPTTKNRSPQAKPQTKTASSQNQHSAPAKNESAESRKTNANKAKKPTQRKRNEGKPQNAQERKPGGNQHKPAASGQYKPAANGQHKPTASAPSLSASSGSPRPGQHSSGLRAPSTEESSTTHRKRRRTHTSQSSKHNESGEAS